MNYVRYSTIVPKSPAASFINNGMKILLKLFLIWNLRITYMKTQFIVYKIFDIPFFGIIRKNFRADFNSPCLEPGSNMSNHLGYIIASIYNCCSQTNSNYYVEIADDIHTGG